MTAIAYIGRPRGRSRWARRARALQPAGRFSHPTFPVWNVWTQPPAHPVWKVWGGARPDARYEIRDTRCEIRDSPHARRGLFGPTCWSQAPALAFDSICRFQRTLLPNALPEMTRGLPAPPCVLRSDRPAAVTSRHHRVVVSQPSPSPAWLSPGLRSLWQRPPLAAAGRLPPLTLFEPPSQVLQR